MGRPPTIDRERLLESARRRFAAKGFEATTLAEVAGGLGVSPAAILRHFPSKRALFAEAMLGGRVELPHCLRELAMTDAHADPREVLRRVATEFVPFIRGVIEVSLAVQMHRNAHQTSLVVPFDTKAADTPPRRAIRLVEDYFRRAIDAGTIQLRDPRAAARLFIGSLHSYVLFHHILAIPTIPLDAYVDALIDLWTHGAIAPPHGGPRARKKEDPANARSAPDRLPRDRGGASLRPPAKPAAAAGVRRNPRGADGERRLARGRTRRPRPRR
jgi:AcrR family transcriptional regulator